MKEKAPTKAGTETSSAKIDVFAGLPKPAQFLVLNYWASKSGWVKPNPYIKATPYPLEYTLDFDHSAPTILTVHERVATSSIAGFAALVDQLESERFRKENEVKFYDDRIRAINDAINERESLKKTASASEAAIQEMIAATEGAERDLADFEGLRDKTIKELDDIALRTIEAQSKMDTPHRSWTLDISEF